jgi:phage terminase small subunit
MAGTRLSPRKRQFAEAYLRLWNRTQAAIEVGYSKRSAYQIGHRLMKDPAVAAYIAERIDEAAMSADEVLVRLSEQARGDIGQFFKVVERKTAHPLPSEEIIEEMVDGYERVYLVRSIVLDTAKLTDPRYSRLIAQFADSPRDGLSVKLQPAQAALIQLGKHLRLWDRETQLNLDMSKLTYEQLNRIAAGEDPAKVLADTSANTGPGGAGATAPADDGRE